MFQRIRLTAGLAVAVLCLAACTTLAGASIAPGTPRQEVVARFGPPTRVVPLANGEQRLQYSLQPAGQYAWMIDLDASGRVVRSRQVLNAYEFQKIVLNEWTRADVEREFGPPARIDGVTSWNGPVMTYRWRDVQNADMYYAIYLDARGIVRRAHPGQEYRDRFFHWR